MYRLKTIIVFAAGFVVAAILFSAYPLVAQDARPGMSAASRAYVKQSVKHIETLVEFYSVASGFFSRKSTLTDVVKEHEILTALMKDVNTSAVPLDLLALETQLHFATYRCETIALEAERLKDIAEATAFLTAPLFSERAGCISEIHQARLRLIDYAVAYGVNPFEK